MRLIEKWYSGVSKSSLLFFYLIDGICLVGGQISTHTGYLSLVGLDGTDGTYQRPDLRSWLGIFSDLLILRLPISMSKVQNKDVSLSKILSVLV